MSLPRNFILFAFPFLFFFLMFGAVPAEADNEPAKEIKTGTITGQFVIKGDGPMSGGQVLFYNASTGPPPSPDKYARISDISKDIGPDGGFRAELPTGKYYMGALKRLSGESFGLPQEGDYHLLSRDKQGRLKEYVVKAGEVLDAGVIAEAVPFKPEVPGAKKTTTAIEGVVSDMDGKPVQDAVVSAFMNSMMTEKPIFVSDRTDKDGKYVLRIAEGKYYLRVRNNFGGGPPVPGQIVGYYGEGTPAAVIVKEGEIKSRVDFKVIRFPGRGPFSGAGPGSGQGSDAGPKK